MLLSFVIITFLSACNSEEEVEEPEVIREGPPPLENPQYVDLGTFIVNMPGDKYFLKSSIQIAFNDPIQKPGYKLDCRSSRICLSLICKPYR